MRELYATGQHPYWCELTAECGGPPQDPMHVGRTSLLYGQGEEARAKLQLVRIDQTVPAGNWAGETKIAFTLSDLATTTADRRVPEVSAHLSVDEAQALQLLLAQYVEFARREGACPGSTDAETIRHEMPT